MFFFQKYLKNLETKKSLFSLFTNSNKKYIIKTERRINMIDEENALFGKTSQENSMLYKPMRKLSITFLEEVKKEVHEKKE